MAKEIVCKDSGHEDCEFEIRSENEGELVELVQRHAENTHDMSVSESDVRGMMRDV